MHELTVVEGDVDQRFTFMRELSRKLSVDPSHAEENTKETEDTHHMFNHMAQSIIHKNRESQNMIDLNKEKFNDAYHLKQLQIQPKIIYVKDTRDQMVMLSATHRGKKVYHTSHQKLYGGYGMNRVGTSHLKKKHQQHNTLSFEQIKKLQQDAHRQSDQHLEDEANHEDHEIIDHSKGIKVFSIQDQISRQEKYLIKKAMLLQKKEIAFQAKKNSSSQSLDLRVSQPYFDKKELSIPQNIPNQQIPQLSQAQKALPLHQNLQNFKSPNIKANVLSQQSIEKIKREKSQDKSLKELLGGIVASQTKAENPKEISPFLRKARNSALSFEDSENKLLRKKIQQMRKSVMKRVDSVNIKLPVEWNSKQTEKSSINSTEMKQLTERQQKSQKNFLQANMSTLLGGANTNASFRDPLSSFNDEKVYEYQNMTQTSSHYNQHSSKKIFQQKKFSQNIERSLPHFQISSKDVLNQQSTQPIFSNIQSQREIQSSYLHTRPNYPKIGDMGIININQSQNYTAMKDRKYSVRELPTKTNFTDKNGNRLNQDYDVAASQNYDEKAEVKSKEGVPLQLPFYNYCGGCNKKNEAFVKNSEGVFIRIQREKDGMKMVIRGDTYQVTK